MKINFLLSIVFVVIAFLHNVNAQTSTLSDKYLKLIPKLPIDSCNISQTNLDNFINQVTPVLDQITTELNNLNETVETKMKGKEDSAKAFATQQMTQQYGISQDQIQKIQSKKMTPEEKKALANQMLQQQTNMSMEEVKNLSTMTEEGKKAYMEAYGAEAMASGQSPQSAQNAENAKKINDLVMKQQNLNSKLNVSTQKIKDLYAFSANNPELENSFDKINEWQTKISLMSGVDYGQGKQMDSLANLIKKEKVKICNKYTPQMRNALKQHYVIMKSMIPDAILLADVTTELNKLQAGFTYPIESREIKALTAIQHYLSSLKEAYKYKLI